MPSSSAPAARASASSVNKPYSFNLNPRSMARSRSAMLCVFDPVKYCMASPAAFRRDQPQVGLEAAPQQHLDLVSPRASTRSTSGWPTNASIRS
jgi:hypothetical protein